MADKINGKDKQEDWQPTTASERLTGIRRKDWLRQFSENMQCYPNTHVSLLQGPNQIRLSTKIIRKMRHSIATYLACCNTAKERKEAKTMLQETEAKLKELDIALPLAEKRESDDKIKQEQVRAEVAAQQEEVKKESKPQKRSKGGLLDMLIDDLD